MKKRSLENGKWKKIVNKHNKKLVALALALAGTLMGAQIPGNIEQVEASQVSVTSATTTNSSTFLTAVRRMDNLDVIKQMNVKSLGDISDSVTAARSIYDKLPAEAKTDKDVVKWEGYLTQKEKGIANRFVALSAQLPTNNQMERMSANDLVVARSRINKIRNLHSKLPINAKVNSGVNRWEGYLTQKENAAGITFVNAARALPSVAEIKEMNEEELVKHYEDIKKVKEAFNALSDTAKSNTQVSTWDTYLATKEDAVYEVAEKLEVELPERAPNDKVEDEVLTEPEETENEVYRIHYYGSPDKIYILSDEHDYGETEVIQLRTEDTILEDGLGNVIGGLEGQEGIIALGTKGRVDAVLSKTDEEQYELTKGLATGTEERYEMLGETSALLPYYRLTATEIEELYNAVDYNKLNTEFGKLVNDHRATLDLGELEFRSEYQYGTKLIAEELADYGFIVPEGQAPHTRPNTDGESTLSVFYGKAVELGYTRLGENLNFHYNGNNPYTIVSEKYLAESMFNSWMNSDGHRAIMESDKYNGFSFAVYPVMNGNTMTARRADHGGYEDYRYESDFRGIGILGALTVMTHP